MQSNLSINRKTGKLIAVFAFVFVSVILCGFITCRNIQEISEDRSYSTKDQDVNANGHVNDMLFSMKGFILFE